MSVSSVDLRVLVHELNPEIIGSWVTNIYHLPIGVFIFKLRKPGFGLQFLLIEPGKRIHLTKFNRATPKQQTNLCKTLRAHLRDRRINSVTQIGLDRLVEIVFGADDGKKVIVELFGEGNLVLVDNNNGKVIAAAKYRKMRDRDIHPGREFFFPPRPKSDIMKSGAAELKRSIASNDTIFNAVNEWASLGPYYTRYILKNAKIKRKTTTEITESEIVAILNFSDELRQKLLKNDYDPVLIVDQEDEEAISEVAKSTEGKNETTGNGFHNFLESSTKTENNDKSLPSIPKAGSENAGLSQNVESNVPEKSIDDSLPDQDGSENPLNNSNFDVENIIKIQPWVQQETEGTRTVHINSLGFAFDLYYSSQEDQPILDAESRQLISEVEDYKKRLEDQLFHQKNMYEESKKLQAEGDAIYLNYTEIEELLKTVITAKRNNMEWDEILKRLQKAKKLDIKSGKILSEIRPDTGKLTVKVPHNKKSMKIVLDFRQSINSQADAKYSLAKKSLRKAKGADIAIKRTNDGIKKLQLGSVREEAPKVTILKRQRRWYERWLWTLAPDKTIILAGMDSKSNEHLLKKFMDDDDLFLHADIQGAPFVVIKSAGNPVKDSCKKLAALLGVCFSSAWKAKRASADAFLLPPEQVSLTAPSGDFLPKGSVMLYGKKELVKTITLELSIGIIIEMNWARVVCGSKESITQASLIVTIRPGDLQKGKLARQIRQKFSRYFEGADLAKARAMDVAEIEKFIPGPSDLLLIEHFITKSSE